MEGGGQVLVPQPIGFSASDTQLHLDPSPRDCTGR